MFVIEEDPSARNTSKKSYGGSKTSRLDPTHQTSHVGYGASSNIHSLDNETSRLATHTPLVYNTPHHSTSSDSRKANKSRFKKYAGAKTTYGDVSSGSSYTPQANYKSDRYKNVSNPSPKHSVYTPSYTDYSSSTPKYSGIATSTRPYAGVADSRYTTGVNHKDYNRYRPDANYHKDYGSKSSHGGGSASGTPSTSYYQPVSSRPYGATYQSHYADAKPAVTDSKSPYRQPELPTAKPDTYDHNNQQSLLQKEDTPEHNVSASIEEKSTKYGGKYQTSDGRIYYGGKPKKYSSKKSKRYQNRRKTMHGDQYQPEKSDRPSV